MKQVDGNLIDNGIYDGDQELWRGAGSPFSLMTSALNGTRVGYAREKLFGVARIDPKGKRALEVGCGGGILVEEIARMGLETIGIDPSGPSLRTANRHAEESRLQIGFVQAFGEALPFSDGTFDVVFCCDVLEHVRDPAQSVLEIGRVLKPGGIFCYDTINRTFASWVVAIKIVQEWKRYALLPPRLHVWEKFIRPGEMKAFLEKAGLVWMGHHGMGPNLSLPGVLRNLRRRVNGKISIEELGRKVQIVPCRSLSLMYFGWAVKPARLNHGGAQRNTEENQD